MRAAVIRGRGAVVLEELPRPEPGPGDVRVRVLACGICGSDLHLLQAGFFAPGAVPGHEFAGVVDAVGPGVTGVAPGTRVAVEPFRTCGTCAECEDGRDPCCREARLLGLHAPGGLAEHVVVPAGRCFPAPAELRPEVAALAEPLAVCLHGLRRGRFSAGQRVLVLGAGSLGLLALVAARAAGAGEVWITARHAHQAALARELGADRVLDAGAAAELDAAARGRPVDLVVETVGGRSETFAPGAAAARPGAAIVVLGVFLAPVVLETLPFLLKELSLVWSYCYAHPRGGARPDFADALSLLARDPERAARLVTHALPLAAAERAFAVAADRKAGAVKVSVLPDGGAAIHQE
jgi:L-iditol 2-dehydrogenase